MSLAKILKSSALIAFGAGAFALAAPAAAGTVVKSSGPSAKSFPVGKKLKDTSRITLKAGDTVTILGSGGTRVLKGAGTYRVGARGKSTRLRFANLAGNRSANRVRTGAARAGSGEALSPNLWYVDVTKSGKMCVTDLANVTLWRPVVEKDQTIVLGQPNNEFTYQITFDGQANTRRVDNTRLALQEGAEYTINGAGGEKPATVSFVVVENTPNNAETMADTLIAQGCAVQLDLLSRKLESEAS